jgi:cytochrome c oxidase assembly protein subunit 15
MGILIFCCLLWTTFIAFQPRPQAMKGQKGEKFTWIILGVAFFQIALGALMSGAKAGLFFPTWPDMNGSFLPSVLLDAGHWKVDSFLDYDKNPFMPALIQFLHRNTAYVLTIMILWFSWKALKLDPNPQSKRLLWLLLGVLATQILLGIFTLINCIGSVPVTLGVSHQAVAVVLIGVVLKVCYKNSERSIA